MSAHAFTVVSNLSQTHDAVAEIVVGIEKQLGKHPIRGIILYAGIGHDLTGLRQQMATKKWPLIGCTSCLGVGSNYGFHASPSLAALILCGDEIRFGVGLVKKQTGNAHALGAALAKQALARGDMSPEEARFAVLHCTPGEEEAVLGGVYSVLSDSTPIIGGSAADNDLSASWQVFTDTDNTEAGAVLAVCNWPYKLSTAYESGYMTAGIRGKVTAVKGRNLVSIDGKPAAEVYNEWTEGSISAALQGGGSVLAETTLNPLGIARSNESGFDCFVLVHPERVLEDHSLSLFANVKLGETINLMTSSKSALVHRTSRVATKALRSARLSPDRIVAGLLIYCGGCLLAVQDQADDVMEDCRSAVKAPFVSAFTFGEVGCAVPRQIDHGNLMAGILLLSNESL